MSFFDTGRIADRKIQEAIEEGAFEDLPGKGQPISLEDDPMTPPHFRLSNRILKNAGVLPDWMQVDIEIDRARTECARTWERIGREYPKRRTRAEAAAADNAERIRRDFAEWYARTRDSYLRALKRINSDILKLNLIAPSVPRVHIPYKMAEETERFDRAFPAPAGAAVAGPQEEKRESRLRGTAQARYLLKRDKAFRE